MDMTMEEAKKMFAEGYVDSFRLEKAVLPSEDWHVYLYAGKNKGGYLVDARKKQLRRFKTLEAAVNAVERVGFKVEFLMRG